MNKAFVILLVCVISCFASAEDPWQRAKVLLDKMTFDEKMAMVHGVAGPYVGNTPPNSRLNIPALNLEDGPQGVADGTKLVTCWPSALTVVATWDVELMRHYAAAMAKEQREKGTNVMLGPMVNIARVPMGGRNFESFGEDPHLSSIMVVPYVKGVQSQGVIANVKHFVDNNQELNRTKTSANVPQRAQWEIYYPAFKAALDAEVGSVMCSYNKINNTYACENDQTLNVDLKKRMGFKGWVMSDWGATHSTVLAANSGLDQQMPDSTFFGSALKSAIQGGQVPMSRLDDMVYRMLGPMFAVGIFDTPQTGNLSIDVRNKEHTLLARKLAAAANVLVKNKNNILPLSATSIKKIAVIGDDGDLSPIFSGGGSGHVIAETFVSPLKGIKNRVGSNVQVSYTPSASLPDAVKAAQEAEVAIVFVATTSHEGDDRPSLSLGGGQDALVSVVAKAQPNTIVVVHNPGAVLMPWVDQVPAIVVAFLPGQEDGNAIASVLFGDVNPSGKLPVTFPMSETEIPINTPQQYPGINNEAEYSEGLQVGYRWWDANNKNPLFPFGHGLSYTTFAFNNMNIVVSTSTVLVTVDIKNTGKAQGAEVVQLYLGYPESAGEPPKVLRGFQKVQLGVGKVQKVSFTLNEPDFSVWDVTLNNWRVAHGEFTVNIGTSSRDIRAEGTIKY